MSGNGYPEDASKKYAIHSIIETDAGVHALSNTCHVDLESPDNEPYEPRYVTSSINKFLCKSNIPIKITSAFAVPETFHCRHNAVKRTYLYKLIVINPDVLTTHPLLQHVPIELNERAWFPTFTEFDEESMMEAAKLFLGYHDFKTFSAKDTSYFKYHGKQRLTRRTITKLSIEKSPMNLYSSYSMPTYYGFNRKVSYKSYDIYIESAGFLHNQEGPLKD
ncbi:tRNA pseudouridine synthase-like 1 isoform X2 [Coccinella septempunctata]|uniref:tRNA pseudouridine synthase-like 1 isoform X2 n=1 Tax=Coccinella septempunctata TaxID=41139 RepID=UPI001D090E18|nr:tRNA pseudouridine synthase-like 1 isoform X2 [Coccinella septempunctata]